MNNVIFDPPTDFDFISSDVVPFYDREVCERLRKISGKDLERHPNPDFHIKVIENPQSILVSTLFTRIKDASDNNRKITLLLSNPQIYTPLAQLINYFRVDCSRVHIFAMNEWADSDGNIAPETYKSGVAHSILKNFVYNIKERYRMPLKNIHYPTNKNISDYSKMITDCGEGGADICSLSSGWSGSMAFIEPLDEFMSDNIEEYLTQTSKIVSLHPLTIAQNSLQGTFGRSGYIAAVPPKGATVGPNDIKNARERIELQAETINNTFSSWQRMTSRLVLHGPVTPLIPASMLQLMKTQVYVSEEIASPF